MQDLIDSLTRLGPDVPRRQVRRGTVLLRPGATVGHGYLVVRGCLRSFVLDAAGKEHILQFTPEGWFVADMLNARDGSPATMYIDALEDSEVISIDNGLFRQLDALPHAVLLRQFTALQNNVIALNKRLVGLLSATAEERYRSFNATYPTLAQRLPLKHIASYLGITPESLSRIRKSTTLG